MRDQTISEMLKAAWPEQKENAAKAFDLFDSWCPGTQRRRVPGMGTTERLAVRLHLGKSIEQAAAAEYVYRWHLAIKPPDQCNATGRHDWRDRRPDACVSIFGAPHILGM